MTGPRDDPRRLTRASQAAALLQRAEGFLATSERAIGGDPPHPYAAHDTARHAAELAAKAALILETGQHPFGHDIGGALGAAKLIPRSLGPREVTRFFRDHTAARYDTAHEIGTDEGLWAIHVATQFVDHARRLLESRRDCQR